jgi:anti-anti-sigma factor
MSRDGGLELSTDLRETGAGRVAVVRAKGEIDLASADRLAEALRGAADGSAAGVVLDSTEVEFMDSSGLRVVMISVSELDLDLALVVAPGSPVSQLLELTDLDGRIPNFTSEDEAIRAIGDGKPASDG